MTPAAPILVIDDDRRALSALEITLRSAGFDNLVPCAAVRDIVAALGWAPYSLVIIDLNTPLAGTSTILSSVAMLEPPPPLLVLAGTPWSRAARQAAEQSDIGWLLKPVDRERLLCAVRRALGQAGQGPGEKP